MVVEAAQIIVAADGDVRGFDEQEAEQAVALLADVTEALGVATGMFAGIEAAVSGDAARAIETRDGIESVNHGESGEQAHAGMGAQAEHAGILLGALSELRFDGQDLVGQGSEQKQGMLALHGEGAGERQGGELLLAASGEEFGAEAQAMAESDGLEAVAQHGADAHETVTVTQQREDLAAGGCRDMDRGEIIVGQQIEQQAGVAAIVFLPAAGELADGQRVADQQAMAGLFDEVVKPQRIAGRLHTDNRGNGPLRVKSTNVVTLMIEQEFVFLAVSGVDPANGLRADMQINSDVHCHLRLLSKPMPNDSG